MNTATIARTARQNLNRNASRSTRNIDWEAVAAVKEAAVEAGAPVIAGWLPRNAEGLSLTAIADAYTSACIRAVGTTHA